MSDKDTLRITEIFFSLQGEGRTVGVPTVFIRLTGCPLRCQYCDTAYAFHGGEIMRFTEIISAVQQYKTKHINVTGGEPLAQRQVNALMRQLCDLDYVVSLETSGALDVSEVDPRVVKVMDVKTPGSKEAAKNRDENIEHLKAHDQVKYVICNHEDYLWSKQHMEQHQIASRCEVLFSPSQNELNPTELADWVIEDQLPVRFQLQLHKMLWGDVAGK